MFGLLFLAFLVVPIVELYVFVEVADRIGFGSTLFWIVAVSVIGAWLVKREGLQALRRANEKVLRGEVPTDELISGILILFAGALMLTPGFLTDSFGLVLLFPPTRLIVRGWLKRRFRSGPLIIGSFGGPTIRGSWPGPQAPGRPGPADVWDAESWEDPPSPDRPELG